VRIPISFTSSAIKTGCLGVSTLLTPKILELSGIGRPDVLHKAGIPVKLALNGVGEDIQEHIYASVTFGTICIVQQDLA